MLSNLRCIIYEESNELPTKQSKNTENYFPTEFTPYKKEKIRKESSKGKSNNVLFANKKASADIGYLKVSIEKINFGIKKVLYIFLGLLLLGCVVQFGYFLMLYPRARRITSLTKTYSLAISTWSSYYFAFTLFTETVFWNNTVPTGTGRTTLEDYRAAVEYIRSNVWENITESLSYDLGAYTENYSTILTTVSHHLSNKRETHAGQCLLEKHTFSAMFTLMDFSTQIISAHSKE